MSGPCTRERAAARARHLLLDEGNAVGVIDWGDLRLADAAVDLALAYTAFAGPARVAFFRAYGEVDAERELRARALGVRLSGFLAAYAAAVDPSRAARRTPRRPPAERPTGRRATEGPDAMWARGGAPSSPIPPCRRPGR